MTIRYTCPECSSVLKIKSDLAGTNARCPKCKRKFVVPASSPDDSAHLMAFVGIEGKPSKESESRNASRPPVNEEAPSSTEFMTDSDEISREAVEPNKSKRTEQATEVDEDLIETRISTKPVTNEFRSAPTVVETSQVESDRKNHREDSEELDDTNPVPNIPASAHADISDDDDDDLDSPAMLISSPMAGSSEIPSISIPEKKRAPALSLPDPENNSEGDDIGLALDFGSDRSTKKTVPQAFDPAKFLVDDERPKSHPPRSPYPEDDDSDIGLSDDSDYDLLNPPTPYPPRRPIVPSVTPRPTPEKVDLAAAAKMMKKAIKDAQSDATRQRQREANPGFDYTQFFREIGFRGVAIIAGLIGMLIVCVFVGNFLVRSSLRTPPLGSITGKITLDGAPLANATIYFRPLETTIKKGRRDQARTSIGTSDNDGNFVMFYSPADNIRGVTAGTCIYWVEHVGATGNDVPNSWTEFERRQYEVKAGQKYVVEISMISERR